MVNKRKRIKQILQQFFIAVVVFSLICPGNLWAKREKPGAKVLITKLNGTKIKGELLKVEKDSLQLLVSETLNKVSIHINEIDNIEIKIESNFWKGALKGGLIFGVLGFGVSYYFGRVDNEDSAVEDGLRTGVRSVVPGILVGGLISAIPGFYKMYQIRGKSPAKIEKIRKKLEKKARFKTEVPENIGQTLGPSNPAPSKMSKIHLTLEPGYFKSQALDDYLSVFNRVDTGDDEVLIGPFGKCLENSDIYLKNIKIEYSISKKVALGFMYSSLNKPRSEGLIIYESNHENYSGHILGECKGGVYYFTAAYMPVTNTFHQKSSFKLGAGIGLSAINLNFRTAHMGFGEQPSVEFDRISFSKNFLSFSAFAGYDYYFNRHLSFGINIEYKYIPIRVEAFQLTGSYGYLVNGQYQQFYRSLIDFPGHQVDFGGFGYGFGFGIHF